MFENEDAILPDDYQEAQPEAEESQEIEATETEVDTLETDEVEAETTPQLTPEQLKFKVKYNHEEQELGYDEAVPLIQKGLNYDKTIERLQALESDPRLSFVEELAQEQNMSVPDYLEAVRASREQQQLDELIEKNIPEEYAKEMLENRKDRESRKKQDEERVKEEKQDAEYKEFFQYYKQANGKDFDADNDKIPQEVWDANTKGVPLKYAFMEHHSNQLKSQLQTFKQNEQNAKRTPVSSLTQYGGTETESEDPFLKGFNS